MPDADQDAVNTQDWSPALIRCLLTTRLDFIISPQEVHYQILFWWFSGTLNGCYKTSHTASIFQVFPKVAHLVIETICARWMKDRNAHLAVRNGGFTANRGSKKQLKLGRCHPTVGVDVGMPHLRFKPRRFLPSKTGGFTLQKVAKNVYWVYCMFFKAAKCWKFLQTEFLKVLRLSSLAVFHLAFQNIFADGTDASRAEVMETNSP